jgi:hypothetical protein
MDFIECSSVKLDKNVCDRLIELFEKNKNLQVTGKVFCDENVEKKEIKKSTEIPISQYLFEDDEWAPPLNLFYTTLRIATDEYVKKYPHLLRLAEWGPFGGFNFQKYNPGDGYYKLHCEVPSSGVSNRMLAWMVYLNDVDDGGTYFDQQDYSLKAECGNIAIWPPYWTHTHRGIVSHTKTKYILTGWFVYV